MMKATLLWYDDCVLTLCYSGCCVNIVLFWLLLCPTDQMSKYEQLNDTFCRDLTNMTSQPRCHHPDNVTATCTQSDDVNMEDFLVIVKSLHNASLCILSILVFEVCSV